MSKGVAFSLLLFLLCSSLIPFISSITITCSGTFVNMTFSSGVSAIFDCSIGNQVCVKNEGCVRKADVTTIDMLCPNDDVERSFSDVTDCSKYVQCSKDSSSGVIGPKYLSCASGAYYNPTSRICTQVKGYCYRNFCQISDGNMYRMPHFLDPYMYIVCLNNTIEYTAGCTTVYNSTSQKCN